MSGGVWTLADTMAVDTRPGIYVNLVSEAQRSLTPGVGTVFVVGRADWGTVDEVVSCRSEQAVLDEYSDGESLPKLARQALRGGAAEVICLRIAGSTAAKADATLVDNNVTPANALTLTALHDGTRANGFDLAIKSVTTGVILEITEDGVLIESFVAPTSDNDDMADLINAGSAYVAAEVTGTSGRDLGVQTASMTGGDSGTTVVAGDYTEAQDIALSSTFAAYVQDDDTTVANQDSVAAWADDQRDEGIRFIAVHGGASAATAANSRTRAEAMDSMSNVYVHPGFVDSDGEDYTGQEAASRIAGMIANAGFTSSITFRTVVGVDRPASVLTSSEIRQGLAAGVCQIVADAGNIRLSRGINTLTSVGSTGQLARSFSKIRTVATVNAIQDGLEAGLTPYIGEVTNDEDGRRSLAAAVLAYLEQLVAAGSIQPNPTVEVTRGEADQVFVNIGVVLLDSIEQVFITVRIGE